MAKENAGTTGRVPRQTPTTAAASILNIPKWTASTLSVWLGGTEPYREGLPCSELLFKHLSHVQRADVAVQGRYMGKH